MLIEVRVAKHKAECQRCHRSIKPGEPYLFCESYSKTGKRIRARVRCLNKCRGRRSRIPGDAPELQDDDRLLQCYGAGKAESRSYPEMLAALVRQANALDSGHSKPLVTLTRQAQLEDEEKARLVEERRHELFSEAQQQSRNPRRFWKTCPDCGGRGYVPSRKLTGHYHDPCSACEGLGGWYALRK